MDLANMRELGVRGLIVFRFYVPNKRSLPE